MKKFLALMFFKGALLEDPQGVLEDNGPNSRSARRMCFRSVEDVVRLLKTAFETLTPGRQREYNLHFSGAKQSKTRESAYRQVCSEDSRRQGLSRPVS